MTAFQISIHTLRMEGDSSTLRASQGVYISIHTLRMEGDQPCDLFGQGDDLISIHTLRMEGDQTDTG